MEITCKHILPPISVVLSIGFSDMIEYYVSPRVHKEHNCPDIMRMRWKDYNGYYAFLSGVKCSWFLILPLCLLRHSVPVNIALFLINILIPLYCRLSGEDKKDTYKSHKLLYGINPIFLALSVIFGNLNLFRNFLGDWIRTITI